ncbi:endo-1,4-beta-xylanase [Thalassobellus citreus]|uniref:endo-1,4-beta-xylanase n=1 Tax=Thalassobellus citreus TaxID=3367752 RepID=UPI0037A1A050
MKIIKLFLAVISILLLVNSCKKNIEEKTIKPSLNNAYKDSFYIGAALDSIQIMESDSIVTALIAKEFNSITAENIMKSKFIHPTENTFDFRLADKYVAFGEKHNMHIHGHTLIWHSQLSPWFSKITDSTEMTSVMKHHIETIVGKYKGKIASWDVVNEALNEDGSLRKTVFLDALGEDYLALAFKTASEVDSTTALYYNDYNMTSAAKRKGAIALIKNLQNKGVKIDGVGMQGHWSLNGPSIEEIETSILEYAALGIQVAVTELDITVLPNPWDLVGAEVSQNFEGDEKMNPYPEKLPDSIKTKLANRYQDIFKLFLKHQDKISRVTFWGVNDAQTWLNNWPIKGRINYPLLFDRKGKPKEAYDSIIALKKYNLKPNN